MSVMSVNWQQWQRFSAACVVAGFTWVWEVGRRRSATFDKAIRDCFKVGSKSPIQVCPCTCPHPFKAPLNTGNRHGKHVSPRGMDESDLLDMVSVPKLRILGHRLCCLPMSSCALACVIKHRLRCLSTQVRDVSSSSLLYPSLTSSICGE